MIMLGSQFVFAIELVNDLDVHVPKIGIIYFLDWRVQGFIQDLDLVLEPKTPREFTLRWHFCDWFYK